MNKLLAAEPDLVLLDVRTPLQHAEMYVAGIYRTFGLGGCRTGFCRYHRLVRHGAIACQVPLEQAQDRLEQSSLNALHLPREKPS